MSLTKPTNSLHFESTFTMQYQTKNMLVDEKK